VSDALRQLRLRLAELSDLRNASRLLGWDQQTMMPPRGAQERAEALATIERISHGMFVAAETGRLLDSAERSLDGTPGDSDDARLVRVTRRRWEKARRVPTELAADLARAASVGQEAWAEARSKSDFGSFAPHLRRNLELAQRYVECFDDFDRAYDVLLDDYEPGMKSSEVARLFEQLRAALVPLIDKLAQSADRVEDSCLHGEFHVEQQRALVKDVIAMMGFDDQSWRIDDAVHPFATSFGSADVRITSRWDPGYFASGLYGAMHECGHGLYEAGIAPELQRTPLGTGESLGLHESQSRLWENMVGRGRPFCGVLAPMISEQLAATNRLAPEVLYRAVNLVKPSYIRVESDEATYGLHIVLRFELEQQLIDGELSVAELPEAWNSRFHDYLGLQVKDDADGVLQDVHWSAGLIGYFPTYALGNLIAGQLWRRAHTDLPELDERIAAGELQPLREWLREHVHRHGAKFSADELLERELGEPLEVEPFIDYLKRKLGDVYELEL
jgi:carboxypeptidase Taq